MSTVTLKDFGTAFFKSYSVAFFSDKILFSVLLLIITFFDVYSGICGLFSVIVCLLFAFWLGFNQEKIKHGFYTFNALLIGIGLGMSYEFNLMLIFMIGLFSCFSLIITVSIEAILGKYYLPYLSIPFLIVYWLSFLATPLSNVLEISSREVVFSKELFVIGGFSIVEAYDKLNMTGHLDVIKLYFFSLSSIFFQFNVVTGVLLSLGILYFSRIAFLLSVIGFFTAFFFYKIFQVNISETEFALIGFNFILTAIAIGGYFFVPSKKSFLWVLVITPITLIVALSFAKIFYSWGLYIYSLPFNFMVILFIYAMKMRIIRDPGLSEVIIQKHSPESNLYSFVNNNHRFRDKSYYSINLPFFGYWNISQGHEGEITHKGEWKHAWDFVITNENGKTFTGSGEKLEDFYCYNKAVLAPADGYITDIVDGISDNRIGDVNLEYNWGNTIIIQHGDKFYSKLSHLKPDSIKVKKGDWVKSGQQLALCGSSGRSPEPHLHFQLQTTPFIEGKTIEYPIAQYVVKTSEVPEFHNYDIPKVNQKVSNLEVNSLLRNAFNLIPGRKITFELDGWKEKKITWEVNADIYNYTFLKCLQSGSIAYFANDGKVFYFYDFDGDKNSLLYHFFLSVYKLPLGFYGKMTVRDTLPVDILFGKLTLLPQDIVAPFFMYLGAKYKLYYESINDTVNPTELILTSSVNKSIFGKPLQARDFKLHVNKKGLDEFQFEFRKRKVTARCIN